MAAAATTPAVGDPARGTFGPQVAWPIMPIHAVLLPSGRVLSYGTRPNGTQTAYYEYDVWNPAAGTGTDAHDLLPNTTQTDIFCSSQIVLPNGDVEMYGGDNLPTDTNTQNREVTQFHLADHTMVHSTQMNRLRWYSSATMLPNGEVYIQGGTGGADLPERRTSSGTFQLLTGASTNNLSSGYPKNWVGPDGLVFGIANTQMYRVNPAGNGSISMLGTIASGNTGGTSTAVMFEPGRILQVGGGGTPASRNANIIDINTGTPRLTALPQAQFGRHWGNATVMADGRVLVSGGSAENNVANGVAYTTEIFNPANNSWSTGATATRMRLYHSTSLLLPDATVITMGGGTPGPETNLNAEIYYPPYLFNDDGTAATRPTITSATTVTDPGGTLSITTPDAAGIGTVSLVKTGSVTHSDDMDQRFINLTFSRSGDTLTANLPTNLNQTPPGHYMIFVLDAAGVPSEATIVRINIAGTPPPPPTTTTTTTLPPTTTHHDHDHDPAHDHHLDDVHHVNDVHHINDDDRVDEYDDDSGADQPRGQRRVRAPKRAVRPRPELAEHCRADRRVPQRSGAHRRRRHIDHRGRQLCRQGSDRAGRRDDGGPELRAVIPALAEARYLEPEQQARRVLEQHEARDAEPQRERAERAVVADRDVHGHGNEQRPHLVPRKRQRQPGGIAR